MFVLKIIVIVSAILNVSFSATQCHSDEVEEFLCQDPNCSTVDGGSSTGRLRITKQVVSVVGYNKDSFLIKKNKDLFTIVGKHKLSTIKIANPSYWKFNVNIHKTTHNICDPTNQNNGEKQNDTSIVHTNTNTDTTSGETSDEVDTSRDTHTKSLQNEQHDESINNETNANVQNDDLDDVDDFNIDDIVKVEIEDELNLDQRSEKMDSNVENLMSKSFSSKNDQKTNSESFNSEKNDVNENANQNNTPKPLSPQQLENVSSTDCTLDSCVIDPNTLQKGLQDVDIEKPNDNIQKSHQLPIDEKMDNSKKETTDNMSQNYNTMSSQDNNVTEEFNMESSNQQNSDNSQITQPLSSLEKMDSSINESINNTIPQNSSVADNSQDNNNVTEESNIESYHQQQSDNSLINQQLSSVETNVSIDKTTSQNSNTENVQYHNDTEEVRTDKSHDQQNDYVPPTQNLPKSEENSITKISVNKLDFNTTNTVVDLKDNNDNTKEINETPSHENTSAQAENQNTNNVVNHQSDKNDMPSLKKEKLEMKYESDIDNVLPINISKTNDIEKQPDIMKDINESDGNSSESQNTVENNLSNVESTAKMSNNDSDDNNTTNSTPLPELLNATETVPSTDNQTVDTKVEITGVSNEQPVDQCVLENGCSNLDSDNQLKPENKVQPYENIQKTLESDNEKSKDFEPKSFISNFGHPEACSGISCLKFKRNIDKSVKSPQPVPKQVYQDLTLQSTNTGFEEENENIINEITEQSDIELNLLDRFQNWLSSPSLSSLDFLWHIFGEHSAEYNDVYTNQPVENKNMFEHIKHNNHSELYFIVAAVITLLFSLVYYKFQKGTYENHLLTLMAAKDQSLLIIEKELSILKEQSSGNSRTTTERNSEIETLNEHLTKSEDIISSQAIRIEKLEQEVEELTESGMEMHTLLSSALESSAKNTEKFNILRVKLVDSENLITALTQKNFDKTTELEKKIGVIKTLLGTVDELTHKNKSLSEDNAKISLQLEQVTTKNNLKESKFLSEINNLQFELEKQTNALLTAENEVSLSSDALREIMSQKFNLTEYKKMSSSIKLSAELKSAKKMCIEYKHKLDESSKLNQQHLDHIDDLKNNIVHLEDNISKLEEEKEESINKLNILTKFFKEQEKEYLKQINEKALICDNKEGESSDLIERIKSLNQEIANYKSEIQSLKKEITDQEASFKIQVSAADKKASDYWILFRQTERKYKEMELETAQLRNKMTMGDKKLENGTKSIDSSKDFEDELLDIPLPTVSPDFTLLSLLDFEPPPPILTNQRLPPLGALGQAPSPPVPLSRRHDRSISPGSPPPSQRSSVFRPLPQRYNYMNRQNSLGHSVESLDK